jgi:superfamily II DNA helicase RecQ
VQYIPPESRLTFVRILVRDYSNERVIIYASRVRTVRQLASQLDYPYYYSEAEDKAAQLKRFRTKEKTVIMATVALELGIDISNIRVVVHFDPPDSLIDLAQESGRAGRDGKASRSIVLAFPPSQSSNDYLDRTTTKLDELVRRYIERLEDRECRRLGLSRYLDGESYGTSCRGLKIGLDIYCDRC